MSPVSRQLNFPDDGFSLGKTLLSNNELSNNKKQKREEIKPEHPRNQFEEAKENLYKPDKYNSFFKNYNSNDINKRINLIKNNSFNPSFDIANMINIFYDQCVKYVKLVFILRIFINTYRLVDLALLHKYVNKCIDQIKIVEFLYHEIYKLIDYYQIDVDDDTIIPFNRNYDYVKNMEFCFTNIKSSFIKIYFEHSNQH